MLYQDLQKKSSESDAPEQAPIARVTSMPNIPPMTQPQGIPQASTEPLPRKYAKRKQKGPSYLEPGSPELAEMYKAFNQLMLDRHPPPLDLNTFELVQDDNLLGLPKSPTTRAKMPSQPITICYDPSTSRASLKASNPNSSDIKTGYDQIDKLLESSDNMNIYDLIKQVKKLVKLLGVSEDGYLNILKFCASLRPSWDHTSLMNVLGILATRDKSNPANLIIPPKLFIKIVEIFDPCMLAGQRMNLYSEFKGKAQLAWQLITKDGQYYKQTLSEPTKLMPIAGQSEQNSFAMIILQNDSGDHTVLIGHGHHYMISGKQKYVYFAGNITFDKDGQVIHIDDHSGGYHSYEGESEAIKQLRIQNQFKLLTELGLPTEVFHSNYWHATTKQGHGRKLSQ